MNDEIVVKGAQEHNLKNIDVTITRGKLAVIPGLSGSGRSSLAFDTMYAEGQRRYVERLSAQSRRIIGSLEKPDVKCIDGAIARNAIDQKSTSRNPRSTVAKDCDAADYLRLLFARIRVPDCPIDGQPVVRQTT